MKVYAGIVIGLAFADLCFGGQGLVITPGVRTTALTDPNIADMQSFTIETGWRDKTIPANNSIISDLNGRGITAELISSGYIRFTDKRDTTAGTCQLDISTRTQFVTRLTRDVSGLKFSCEIWNYDGSGYAIVTLTVSSINAWVFSGGAIGDNGAGTATSITCDFDRVYLSILPLGSKPPTTFWTGGTSTTEPGTATAWKFDGNGNDASGNSHTVTTSSFSFSATTHQGPQARWTTHSSIGPWASVQPSWSDWLTLKVGTAEPLDGSAGFSMADGCNDVTHVWSQISGPAATLGSTTSAHATINPSAFGTYVLRDTVTDCNAASAFEDMQIGAAPFSSKGVLDWIGVFGGDTVKADIASYLFGAYVIVFGQATAGWELVDRDHQQFSEAYGNVYGIAGYPTPWNTALAGTITCVATTCTGTGTAFLTDFPGCDATHPPTDQYLVPWYQDAVNVGRFGRDYVPIATCASNTSLTLVDAIPAQTPCAACRYAKMPFSAAGPIVSSAGSAEYAYCNSCGHYMLYFRSGNSKYRDYARYLLDWLFYAPKIDAGVFFGVVPRIFPTYGPFVRMALDDKAGDVDYARFLHNMEGRCQSGADYFGDIREVMTQCVAVSLGANWDPDPTIKAAMKVKAKDSYDNRFGKLYHQNGAERWYVDFGLETHLSTVFAVTNGSATVTRSSGASIPNTACGVISTRAGTISVTNGSATVVGSGTSLTGLATKGMIIFGTLSSAYYKQVFTVGTVTDATHFTLGQKWYGDTASGLSFVVLDYAPNINNYVPIGWMSSDVSGTLTPVTVNGIVFPQNPDPNDEWYACTWVDGDHLTLDKVFTGTTGYRRIAYYEFAPNGIQVVPGMPGKGGTQPILYASAIKMFRLNYKALGATTDGLNQLAMAQGIEAFLRTSGFDPVALGLYYEVLSPVCTPTLPETLICNAPAYTGARDYSNEANDAFNQRFIDDPSAVNLALGDIFFGAQYGCAGYNTGAPYADGICGGTAPPGEITGGSNPKYLGFRFGLGASWAWPAIRTLYTPPAAGVRINSSIRTGSSLRK